MRDDADVVAVVLLPTHLGDTYRSHGYVSPLTLWTPQEASRHYELLLGYEAAVGCSSESRRTLSGDDRFKIHLLLPWAWELVHHPVLVRAVQECLQTADVWCWSTDLNIKEPCSKSMYTWHQDAAFANMEPSSGAVTVWVAFTRSDVDSGCVYCIPGTHHKEMSHAVGRGGDGNVLTFQQEVDEWPPELQGLDPLSHAEPLELEPGQASIHSFRAVHASMPNTSPHRRVGLAIRYVSAHCQRKDGCLVKEMATLVSGNGHGLFEPECKPLVALGEQERKNHATSLELERRNYLPSGQSYK
jgi:non-haem Fe2+, alpha-ketoglutarate-dependent halogenase